MQSDRIILLAPGFDQNLGLLQCAENLTVQELIAQASVEAFDVTVLPGAPWRDISRLCTDGGYPKPALPWPRTQARYLT